MTGRHTTSAVSPKHLVATLWQFRQSYCRWRACGKSPTGENRALHAVRRGKGRPSDPQHDCASDLGSRSLYPPEASRRRPSEKLVVGREGESRSPMHTGGMDSTPTASWVNGTHAGVTRHRHPLALIRAVRPDTSKGSGTFLTFHVGWPDQTECQGPMLLLAAHKTCTTITQQVESRIINRARWVPASCKLHHARIRKPQLMLLGAARLISPLLSHPAGAVGSGWCIDTSSTHGSQSLTLQWSLHPG